MYGCSNKLVPTNHLTQMGKLELNSLNVRLYKLQIVNLFPFCKREFIVKKTEEICFIIYQTKLKTSNYNYCEPILV